VLGAQSCELLKKFEAPTNKTIIRNMNKRRKNNRELSLLEMTIISVAGVVLLAGGVLHAFLKNNQVDVFHEMDRTQRHISDQKDMINSLQVKIDKKLNIYQLRDDLESAGSRLVVLPVSAIERIPAYREPTAVASTEDVNPALALANP